MARPTKERKYLYDKQAELIWALAHQDYRNIEIAVIFNLDRSRVGRIIGKMPKGWVPKWVKVQ